MSHESEHLAHLEYNEIKENSNAIIVRIKYNLISKGSINHIAENEPAEDFHRFSSFVHLFWIHFVGEV